MEVTFILKLFFVAFFLNLLWEVLHSTLYTTCHQLPLGASQRLLVFMSLKDAFWVVAFYTLTNFVFGVTSIFDSVYAVLFFVLLALVFSGTDEYVSLRRGRWEYTPTMPRLFGVGVSPLFELVVTGVAALGIVSLWM